ncbi:MAG: sulfatase-like hydrolase/transferase, partial [Clostridiales bacterium]|nr:sulfatase-like hydrolase/transferase [Clostridiales bacterium]
MKERTHYIKLNMLVSFGLILVASLALALVVFAIQPASIVETWVCVRESGYLTFFLNWIPIISVILLIYFVFNNVVIACGISGAVVILFSAVNRNMINIRQDPFKPYDLMLGNELLGIARSLDITIFVSLVISVVVFLALLIVCVIFIRNKPMNLMLRCICVAVSIVNLAVVNKTVLSNSAIYDDLYMVGNVYNTTDNFQSKGFLYSFLYTLNTDRIVIPDNYNSDKPEIERRLAEFVPIDFQTPELVKPNVILILAEAFSDILINPELNFDDRTDPMANYKRIADDSITGYIVVPNIGGGTADTEFDIFTGLNTRHFRATAYTYNLVTNPMDALPTYLSRLGYDNIALHPGFGWFYNRNNVYKYLGFSDFLASEYFDTSDTRGMYITEKQTIKKIIDEYDKHMRLAPDIPFFEFCVTIQNHGPYPGKYNAEKNFDTTLNLSEKAQDALANYIVGMIDADRELNNLVTYLNDRPEPVVLVMYGDHLPSFTTEIYNALIPGEPDESFEWISRLYKCPFVIWQNKAASEQT